MSLLRRFSWLLVVNTLAGFVLGAEITSKYVCPGNSIAAFQNITFKSCDVNVSLSKLDEDALIAKWSKRNCSMHSEHSDVYMLNVYLDESGTIWIHNVHRWDEGIYVVLSKTNEASFINTVQIIVMVAPTMACKPKILKLKDSLYALLNDSDCSKPVPTLYWKNPSGVRITSDPVLKIIPAMEAGKYYACIEGLVLTCAINLTSTDYCSTFDIAEGQITSAIAPFSSEVWYIKIVFFTWLAYFWLVGPFNRKRLE